jgi:orotate phosphoribosyltransferase
MTQDATIVVRKACKYYGSNGITHRFYPNNEKKVVLDDLNMTVPRGSM